MSKLGMLNKGDKATLWFRDYLRGRRQRFHLGAATSSLLDMSFGVPQGSLLGPTLFIALTFDLPAYLDLDKTCEGVTIYADDCCLWVARKDAGIVKARLEGLTKKLLTPELPLSQCRQDPGLMDWWFLLPSHHHHRQHQGPSHGETHASGRQL